MVVIRSYNSEDAQVTKCRNKKNEIEWLRNAFDWSPRFECASSMAKGWRAVVFYQHEMCAVESLLRHFSFTLFSLLIASCLWLSNNSLRKSQNLATVVIVVIRLNRHCLDPTLSYFALNIDSYVDSEKLLLLQMNELVQNIMSSHSQHSPLATRGIYKRTPANLAAWSKTNKLFTDRFSKVWIHRILLTNGVCKSNTRPVPAN